VAELKAHREEAAAHFDRMERRRFSDA